MQICRLFYMQQRQILTNKTTKMFKKRIVHINFSFYIVRKVIFKQNNVANFYDVFQKIFLFLSVASKIDLVFPHSTLFCSRKKRLLIGFVHDHKNIRHLCHKFAYFKICLHLFVSKFHNARRDDNLSAFKMRDYFKRLFKSIEVAVVRIINYLDTLARNKFQSVRCWLEIFYRFLDAVNALFQKICHRRCQDNVVNI